MIIGLGTDIINIERIENSITKFGEHFLTRTFSEDEQVEILAQPDARHQASKAAKLFAAKEAAVKALGTGFTNGIRWQDVVVSHDELGKPILSFYGRALEQLTQLSNNSPTRLYLSLSDDFPLAMAVVIIEI